MRVLITGVHGFLGGELARRFAAQGSEVVGLSRRRPEGLALAAFHAASLGQAAPAGAFAGADLVVHAAHDRSPGSQDLNVEGTQAWAEQARAEGAARQLFLSSVSAHASAPSEYGRAKAALERCFEGTGGLLLRPGLVVGPGGTFGDLVRALRRFPVLPVLGGDSLQVVLCDVDSLFQVVQGHAKLESGRAYNVFQPGWVGLLSLAKTVRAHFSARTLLLPLPAGPAIGLLELGRRLGLPRTLSAGSLKNLQQCRGYGYESSYGELGLGAKSLEQMLSEAFPA